MLELNKIYNMDCMDGMKEFPDNYFELAIVDPPYGIGEDGSRGNPGTEKWKNPNPTKHKVKKWDKKPPSSKYFKELFRISKNQIIWGANYYPQYFSKSMGWIFWDKKTGNSDYSDGELAFTSFNKALRKFEWLWNGFRKEQPEDRIHPTQKPVALYGWLLNNYAKPGDKILDTHLGSASSVIACIELGFEYIGFEIDKDYFKAAKKRIEQFEAQTDLFRTKAV